MIGSGIYPEKLAEVVVKYKQFIPRRLHYYEHLKLYHRYWNEELGEFKVKDFLNFNGVDYYFINYENDKQGLLTYPINYDTKCYELLRNFETLQEESVINNRTRTFTGAEIRFWFVVNNIDFSDEENYKGFLCSLVYENGVKDTAKYMVRRNKKQNIFEFIEK